MAKAVLHNNHRCGSGHLLIPVFKDSACAPKEAQEHKLCLLKARVAGDCVQYKLLHFLCIIWSLAKYMLQEQAVVLNDLQAHKGVFSIQWSSNQRR